jgi:protein-disulfide isomerase
MDENPHPYRWHIIFVLIFFSFVTTIFFIVGSKPKADIIINTNEVEKISKPTITIIDPQIGTETATLTVIEFGDFHCSACKENAINLKELYNTYPDKVRIVWKDFPNESLSEQATPSAIAARCADNQDAFWEYHDELFLRQTMLGETVYYQIAEGLELNMKEFTKCYQSQEPLPRVKKSFEEGLALDLTATPTVFINGERYVGAISYADLQAIFISLD